MKIPANHRPDYRALVKEFEIIRHNTTQRQFCLDAGIGLPAFQFWLYKLRHEVKKPQKGFSRLKIKSPQSSAVQGMIEIHFPDQTILKLPGETSVEIIKQLLSQLKP